MIIFILFIYRTGSRNPELLIRPLSHNGVLNISLHDDSLVFINSNNYQNNDFYFVHLKENISVEETTHYIFREGESLQIYSNINDDINLSFWLIPKGMCDSNSFVVETRHISKVSSYYSNLSKFCFFSSLKSPDANSLLSFRLGPNYEKGGISIYSNKGKNKCDIENEEQYTFDNSFLIVGKNESLTIGPFFFLLETSDNNCSLSTLYDHQNPISDLEKALSFEVQCLEKLKIVNYLIYFLLLTSSAMTLLCIGKSQFFTAQESFGFSSRAKLRRGSEEHLEIEVPDMISGQKEETIL